MPILNQLPNLYLPLSSNVTESPTLLIDTQANPKDSLDAAVERIRAAADLLETLHCLYFKHADVRDIPHITHATQHGNDLLQVAQQQMLSWKARV